MGHPHLIVGPGSYDQPYFFFVAVFVLVDGFLVTFFLGAVWGATVLLTAFAAVAVTAEHLTILSNRYKCEFTVSTLYALSIAFIKSVIKTSLVFSSTSSRDRYGFRSSSSTRSSLPSFALQASTL